jgi:hypothetical protein
MTVRSICTTLALTSILAAPGFSSAGEHDLLSFGGGGFNALRSEVEAEFRLEYRSRLQWLVFRPFASFAATNRGSVLVGAGVLAEVVIADRFVVTASLAPHYYARGNSPTDLGYPLEFRSQGEIAYRFENGSRLGVAFGHYSNGGFGDTNPGVESITLYYSLPLRFAW